MVLEVSADHPSQLFVLFHQTGQKVGRARILIIIIALIDILAQAL